MYTWWEALYRGWASNWGCSASPVSAANHGFAVIHSAGMLKFVTSHLWEAILRRGDLNEICNSSRYPVANRDNVVIFDDAVSVFRPVSVQRLFSARETWTTAECLKKLCIQGWFCCRLWLSYLDILIFCWVPVDELSSAGMFLAQSDVANQYLWEISFYISNAGI